MAESDSEDIAVLDFTSEPGTVAESVSDDSIAEESNSDEDIEELDLTTPEPHPLYQAIADGDLAEVKRWIFGLPVDCTHLITDNGGIGYTPLERAAYRGRVDVVIFLIGHGADVNRCGRELCNTPLSHALINPITNDHIACVKVLLAAGADVNAQVRVVTGMSPLALVVARKHVAPQICRRLCSVLLRAGANISDVQLDDYTDYVIRPYLQKIANAGGFKAYAKAHRQKLVAMFVRTRCFQRVPDEIVPLIVDYGFHVGFY